MPEGIVVRGQGGFYFVKVRDNVFQCSGRGKIKKGLGEILVGDHVFLGELSELEGVIEEVKPRKNKLIRPAIANVDQVITVFAVKTPDPIPLLIDKFLVMIGAAGLEPVIVFNKVDLIGEATFDLGKVYEEVGYPVYLCSTVLGQGIDELKKALQGKVSVFSGPSGVGKSALLNQVQESLYLETGDISQKIGRGRHTTRHASLIPLREGGWVADTPGFSVLDLTQVKKDELQGLFPEFIPFMDSCRFSGCLHRAEPDCAVKDAVGRGTINNIRYQNYVELLSEIEALPPEWARKSEI